MASPPQVFGCGAIAPIAPTESAWMSSITVPPCLSVSADLSHVHNTSTRLSLQDCVEHVCFNGSVARTGARELSVNSPNGVDVLKTMRRS